MLPVGEKTRVRKLDYATRRVAASWVGTLIALTGDHAVVRAPFVRLNAEPVVVAGVPFLVGDLFTEFYYFHRWYNVFHVADSEGRAKGWYCNVASPVEIDAEGLAFVDLALDLFVRPDGTYEVLDEEEFSSYCGTLYRPEDEAKARGALMELRRMAVRGSLPTPRG